MKSLDLWQVRELNRHFSLKGKEPLTVVVFKVFSGSTPTELINELFDFNAQDNLLPYALMNLHTRVDYRDLGYDYFDPKEALVYFKVEGSALPPKIQKDNFVCLRKGVDSDLYRSALYDKVIHFGWSGNYIAKWDKVKVKQKIEVLKKFFHEAFH